MAKKRKKKRPNNGRDYLLVKLICGATKASTHVDKRKKKNKEACRGKVKEE